MSWTVLDCRLPASGFFRMSDVGKVEERIGIVVERIGAVVGEWSRSERHGSSYICGSPEVVRKCYMDGHNYFGRSPFRYEGNCSIFFPFAVFPAVCSVFIV